MGEAGIGWKSGGVFFVCIYSWLCKANSWHDICYILNQIR